MGNLIAISDNAARSSIIPWGYCGADPTIQTVLLSIALAMSLGFTVYVFGSTGICFMWICRGNSDHCNIVILS